MTTILKTTLCSGARSLNYIEVDTQPLRPDTLQEVYRSNDPVTISAGQTKTITVFYNESPCINAVASLEDAPAGCIITLHITHGAQILKYIVLLRGCILW